MHAGAESRPETLLRLVLVVRVRKNGLFARPDLTVAEVRAALVAAGWRP